MKYHFIRYSIFLLLILLVVKVNAQQQSVQLDSKAKKQVIEQICDELKSNYIFLDTALRMNSFIRQQLKSGVYDTIKNSEAFASALTKDLLSVYHDGHLFIRYDPQFPVSTDSKDPDAEKKLQQRRLDFRKRVNFGFDKAEMLPGNVGYLKIGGFFESDNDTRAMVLAALRFVSNSHTLIIDLRNNMGGDPDMVSYICSFFFKNKTHLNDIYSRQDKSFTSHWTTPDTLFSNLNAIPIYILTSHITFSAGEEFTYDLQTQKRATVIGEPTGGGAHPVSPHPVSNGFVANIPFARAINPVTKTNWEGKGVTPDIKTAPENALDTALEMIKNKGQ